MAALVSYYPLGSPTFSSPSSQTLGVGTCTYAAPEQLHNTGYCSKVDIYSLGIVLFEFFQPFNTDMEKHKCIKDLRMGVVPQEFRNLWPEQVGDLILMVCTVRIYDMNVLMAQ
jgi:translation initiation factor 2-alpha kinase 1